MFKDFIGWSLESTGKATVETKYTVEYITDGKIADELERTGDSSLYTTKEFDNVSEAMTFYFRWFIDDSCIIVHLWEQIYINDEMVLEQMIEPAGKFKYLMQSVVDNGMRKDLHKAEINNAELRKSNKLYSDFIKALGTQYAEMFKEFCNKEAQNI